MFMCNNFSFTLQILFYTLNTLLQNSCVYVCICEHTHTNTFTRKNWQTNSFCFHIFSPLPFVLMFFFNLTAIFKYSHIHADIKKKNKCPCVYALKRVGIHIYVCVNKWALFFCAFRVAFLSGYFTKTWMWKTITTTTCHIFLFVCLILEAIDNHERRDICPASD